MCFLFSWIKMLCGGKECTNSHWFTRSSAWIGHNQYLLKEDEVEDTVSAEKEVLREKTVRDVWLDKGSCKCYIVATENTTRHAKLVTLVSRTRNCKTTILFVTCQVYQVLNKEFTALYREEIAWIYVSVNVEQDELHAVVPASLIAPCDTIILLLAVVSCSHYSESIFFILC